MARTNTPIPVDTEVKTTVVKVEKIKSGRVLAVFALIFSLVSLVGVGVSIGGGWLYYKEQSLRADKAASNDDAVKEALGSNNAKFAAVNGDIGLITQSVDNNRQSIENLNQTFNYLFQDRYRWLLNEVEYGLGIISLQLINTGNVEAALKSLLYLRDRLAPFDSPELIVLKKSLAADAEDLKTVNTVDLSATLVQLEVLNSKVDSLSLLLDTNLKQNIVINDPMQKVLSSSPWYVQIWDNITAALKSGIQVRQFTSADPLLISPEQAFFVRENIKLLLMDARLALLQRQQDTFTQDLDAVKTAVHSYFDPKGRNVIDFLNTLDELAKLNILSPNVDLIKNSLAIVKSLQSKQAVRSYPGAQQDSLSSSAAGLPKNNIAGRSR